MYWHTFNQMILQSHPSAHLILVCMGAILVLSIVTALFIMLTATNKKMFLRHPHDLTTDKRVTNTEPTNELQPPMPEARPVKLTHAFFFFLFLLLIQLFIPLLGFIIVICLAVFLHLYRKKIYPIDIGTFKNPIYIRKTPVAIKAYAEGWASVRLSVAQFSESERKQALISLARGAKQNINVIYQQLVSDDMEELRICAFSLLENQQNYLHQKINELLKIEQRAPSSTAKAFYAKQLALLYWEFVYLNLGEHEFRKIILEKSEYYARIAIDYYAKDPALLILLSRIAIANHDTAQGLQLLKQAHADGAPNNKVYPYLAEASYRQRHFQKVQDYLGQDPSFRYILKLNRVVNFWCKKHDSLSR